ncbi:MAG TPA: carbonate dehydratase [Verrucomicrobiales bacterium]|jgi:carbonic anhydrase|nr:carbonate dehydratase [Verrucomicrobiales bacterium]
MSSLNHLFEKNRQWAAAMEAESPGFFQALYQQQAPEYLWIGCSDSRVPANEIVGLLPGELFVHRNVANVVVHSDLNCLAVVQYAVEVLKVKHVIVTGHYNCGGVNAALQNLSLGLIDNWLRHVQDVYRHHKAEIDVLTESKQRARLCELNVLQQVVNVSRTTIVRGAWNAGQPLSVHGMIYDVKDGLLHQLVEDISNPDDADALHAGDLKKVKRGAATMPDAA